MTKENKWTEVGQAIDWVHSLTPFGIKTGLERMHWMMERLGHPERKLKFIHIGGTNGKGSTLSFLRHVLQQAGYTVGSFTSPYIIRFQERIQIDGEDIPDEDLLAVAKRIKPLADELSTTELGSPTEFEVLTAVALCYFAHVAYPDLVLWEVGLGGASDSTNIVIPLVSLITNIGYDHTDILGERIEDIAKEKAGIIKAGIPVVTGTRDPEALEVIRCQAQEMKASLYTAGQSYHLQTIQADLSENRADLPKKGNEEQVFSYRSMFTTVENVRIGLQGAHQMENAGLALMALDILKQYYHIWWEEGDLRTGLQQTDWPGRLEIVAEHPLTVLDGAHNPQGMTALAKEIRDDHAGRIITVFFCGMKDKKILDMLQPLQGSIDRLILTECNYPRVQSAQAVLDDIRKIKFGQVRQTETNREKHPGLKRGMDIRVEKDWRAAYREIRDSVWQVSEGNELILFTGSLYFISEVRWHILQTY